MTTPPLCLSLTEWECHSPENDPRLAGWSFGSASAARLASELSQQGLLELTELRTGLEVRARSHVGTVRLGDLTVSIRPKLNQSSLLNLLRYAYGFRKLRLFDETTQRLEHAGFEDLLVSQLNAEASELLARGLHRHYVARRESLASPRGRIDIPRIASDGGVTACLPCTHHPRIEDTLLNRVLLGGLLLAADVASDVSLQRQSRRLATMLADGVSRLRLDAMVLDRLAHQMTRLTVAYEAAVSIIRLLVESRGVSFDGAESSTPFPGFLFDMNRFFQALLSRFLGEYLTDCTVRDEHHLRGMLQYAPGFNPRCLLAPIPRPDFVIEKHGHTVTILDAKYRDLWAKELPREMLYQLSLYATSHAGKTATILYPTTDVVAREARLNVRDPLRGSHLAQVRLRPVSLGQLEKLVREKPTAAHQRSCRAYARKLTFGDDDRTW